MGDTILTALKNAPALYQSYVEWVKKHPLVRSVVGRAIKWIIYYISGQINGPDLLHDLMSESLPNLGDFLQWLIDPSSPSPSSSISASTSASTSISTITTRSDELILAVLDYLVRYFKLIAFMRCGVHGQCCVMIIIFIIECVKCLYVPNVQSNKQSSSSADTGIISRLKSFFTKILQLISTCFKTAFSSIQFNNQMLY